MNPRCIGDCRNINICKRMELRGNAWKAGGDLAVAAEFLGIDSLEQDVLEGVYTEDEGIRIATLAAPIESSQQPRMQEAGELLVSGAIGMSRALIEACIDGPDEAGNCRSEQGRAFMFTEEDLN